MFFLVDDKKKIIIGWSPKCGCSRIKRIFWFLQNNNVYNVIHTRNDHYNLPNNIEDYETLIFTRNPYKRIISGYLDKYNKNAQFIHLWKHEKNTFSIFVDELIKHDWKMIEKGHFEKQTGFCFDKYKITRSKSLKIYDIENNDYSYLEKLYEKKIPEKLLIFNLFGHERKNFDKNFEEPVYDLDIDIYYQYNVNTTFFYNEEIKNKVYNFYIDDFTFFKDNGIDYEIST